MARLWLDDRRKPPWGYDLWAKNAPQAIQMLQDHAVEHVSLDHDLHEEHYADVNGLAPIDRSKYRELTGYAVLEWMHANNRWVVDIHVHSLNGKGVADMLAFQDRAPSGVTFRRVKPWEV